MNLMKKPLSHRVKSKIVRHDNRWPPELTGFPTHATTLQPVVGLLWLMLASYNSLR